MDTPKEVRLQNTALSVDTTLARPSARSSAGVVASGGSMPPYNARQVYPYDSSSDSAYIDAFTGVMNEGRLTEIRDRAVYDLNTLTWDPIADSGTGVMFPDAVTAKTVVETALRVRPTAFKGPKQLDISMKSDDQHYNRGIHPNGWKGSKMPWYKNKGDLPFVGYPNPNLFNAYTDIIPTHNVQNLSHSQLTDAMRAMEVGNFDHDKYLQTLGSLLTSDAVPAAATANIDKVIQTDGGGVNGDPRLVERVSQEYEVDFNLAKRVRVADATNDPRFIASAPGMQYQAEQDEFARAQETQFSKINQFAGIASGYMTPEVFHVG